MSTYKIKLNAETRSFLATCLPVYSHAVFDSVMEILSADIAFIRIIGLAHNEFSQAELVFEVEKTDGSTYIREATGGQADFLPTYRPLILWPGSFDVVESGMVLDGRWEENKTDFLEFS